MNIKAKITPVALAIALAAGFGLPAAVQASGGGSGPAVTYVAPGQIGEIVVNPYKIAPLTAVIKNGGYLWRTSGAKPCCRPSPLGRSK